MSTRVKWVQVLDAARAIAAEYRTAIILRQLFYRLVAKQVIPNLQSYYRGLSAHTAAGRRDGTFPDLADEGSEFYPASGDSSPAEALRSAAANYRRDRSEGQPYTIVAGVAKRGMVSQLLAWFGALDIVIVATGGYASQTLCHEVKREVLARGRPAILLMAVDHDPTGPDILRDFVARTDCWHKVIQVALTKPQTRNLPPYAPTPRELEKLRRDPRAKAFARRNGSLVQYEVDALPPDELRNLYRRAIDQFWDQDAYEAVLAREAAERAELTDLADNWRP